MWKEPSPLAIVWKASMDEIASRWKAAREENEQKHWAEAIRLVREERARQMFVTKDSGKREEYPSGMRRDTQQGKPDYMLLDRDFLSRWAALMTRGAEKYGANNWQLANSEAELERFKSSAFRHFMQWLEGEIDEDHAVAVAFNLAAAEHVKKKLKEQETVVTDTEKQRLVKEHDDAYELFQKVFNRKHTEEELDIVLDRFYKTQFALNSYLLHR